MSNSSSNNNNQLFGTAVAAAAAGAALAYAAMTMSQKNNETRDFEYEKRKSFIYEDPNNDSFKRSSSENILFPHSHEEKMRRRIAQRYAVEEENSAPRNKVTVKVPATSANMGPGCKYKN